MIDWIKGLFQPALETVDKLFTSEEERLKVHGVLNDIMSKIGIAVIGLETEKLKVQLEIEKVRAEGHRIDANGVWYQKGWRPASMAVVVALFAWHCVLKLLEEHRLGEIEIYMIAGMLGVVGVGRTGEKMVTNVVNAMKK